ncbi:MAG: serine hydrolase domain-containing protein [Schleiferilactobacillus perolens]|jgi:CubicO group peptidase (beta-lactamase class C family)|uniref:serine hydrolase domain-containing protein n=1 Tax=Schleiferilactobacillus perolens TaxID=100468 RepID=UPI0039EA37AB
MGRKMKLFVFGVLIATGIALAGGTIYYIFVVHPQDSTVLNTRNAENRRSMTNQQIHKNWVIKKMQEHPKNSDISQSGTQAVDRLANKAQTQLQVHIKQENIVGSLLLIQNGTIIYHQGFGFANAATRRFNTVRSLYQIGSAQKSITAVAIAQLVKEGKVHYGDNIHSYYVQIPSDYHVTIRQMLNMTSGFNANLQVPTKPLNDAQTVHMALTELRYNAKGYGQFNYQPVNYVLLAGIVAAKSGETYEQYVDRHFFVPLHLSDKQMGFEWNLKNQVDQTTSYALGPGSNLYSKVAVESVADMRNELGTGNIYSSTYAFYRLEKEISSGRFVSLKQLAILRNTTGGKYGGGIYNYANSVYSHGVKNSQELLFMMSNDGKTAALLMLNRATTPNGAARQRIQWYYQFARTAAVVKSSSNG